MGETAACLARSFSQPSPTSEEEKRGNSIQRALTASVSFGRFMSESMDWEKWSAFTNNRYLEEVEKYSKPGSVAEKKAYFEAHFKRRRAAALLEQQNAEACAVSETASSEDKVEDSSSLDLCHPLVIDNMKEADIKSSHDERTLEDTKLEGTEKAMNPLVIMGDSLDLTNHLEDDVYIGDMVFTGGMVFTEEYIPAKKDDSAVRNSGSGEEKPEVFSAQMLTKGCSFKCSPPMPTQLKDSDGDKSPESKRNSMDSSNKRRSHTTSLHMSINFASCSDVTQKDKSLGLPKIETSRAVRASGKKYKNSALPHTSTGASVSGLIKHFSVASPAENRRTLRLHGDSISEDKTTNEKVQSPSSKSSNSFGNKARLQTTVPSSFTFKSEERAVKRREFFQMLEQKVKSKEKHQIHAKPQVTGKNHDKSIRNSAALEISKVSDAPLRNITKKIPTTRPLFPKFEERDAAFRVRECNIVRPPWRFSVKTEGSKDSTVKNNHQPKKISSENASPNIQL